METIKAAAIKRSDGVIIIARDHAQCIMDSPDRSCLVGGTQGFVTDTGRFVSRKTAGRLAWAGNQIYNDPNGNIIFSEEIWSTGPCYWDNRKQTYILKDTDVRCKGGN